MDDDIDVFERRPNPRALDQVQFHPVEVGDADALERAMQEIPEVVSYDMERIDDRSCYVYVRDATTDSLQEMFEPISSGGIIVVAPIESDGTVVVSMLGSDDEVQEAIEGVSVLVAVTIEAVKLTSREVTLFQETP